MCLYKVLYDCFVILVWSQWTYCRCRVRRSTTSRTSPTARSVSPPSPAPRSPSPCRRRCPSSYSHTQIGRTKSLCPYLPYFHIQIGEGSKSLFFTAISIRSVRFILDPKHKGAIKPDYNLLNTFRYFCNSAIELIQCYVECLFQIHFRQIKF